jgi:hypothetical protein
MPTGLPNQQLSVNQHIEKESKSFSQDYYIKLIGEFAKMNCGPNRFVP